MLKGNVILFVLSFLTIIAGIAIYFEASEYQKKAKITEGIVEHRLGSSYRIKYKSDDGLEHTFRGSQKNNKYRQGDMVKIFYRTDNPERARISDGKKAGKTIIKVAIALIALNVISVLQAKARNRSVTKAETTRPEKS